MADVDTVSRPLSTLSTRVMDVLVSFKQLKSASFYLRTKESPKITSESDSFVRSCE